MAERMTARHSIRCNKPEDHGPHEWAEDGSATWWCMGTDDVDAVNSLNERTSDGTLIRHGLKVIDYNRREATVIGVQSLSHGTFWFKTTTGMFDGSRLQAKGAR